MTVALDHRELYRLPWNLSDNAIAWLEPTMKCNLACEGCYRANVNEHKTLEQVAADLDVFARYRKTDGVSIAGGDPLTHPEVVSIVRMVADRGWKPIVNTNGLALTEALLRDMKQAGLFGVTFHIDSKQHRPKWKNKTEQEHNALRLHFAEMVARVGGITCSFNATVYEDTLDEIPGMLAWAQRHIDIVHVMVFICYREPADPQRFDYYVGDRKVDMTPLTYEDTGQRIDISAHDVVAKIREQHPDFAPAAYLNGTAQPDAFKWLLTVRVGTAKRIYGYLGRKIVELAQVWHHLRAGRYLAYAEPAVGRRGRLMALLLWPFDRGLRRVLWRALRSPAVLFRRLHLQSIMVISPVEILDNGEQDMCDGCPDMTVYDGGLAWSCRLEECIHFGQFTRTVPVTATHGDRDLVPLVTR